MSEPTENLPMPAEQKKGLVQRMADVRGVDPGKYLSMLKNTAFRQPKGGEVSNEHMMMLLLVSDRYRLDPLLKEIYAFPDKGGIVPVVGVDGWSRIINEQPQCDGISFEYPPREEWVKRNGKLCPEEITCVIWRKDRAHPTRVTEYLDEVYRDTGPWKSHTKRMLRHKALIQAGRVAFGLTGIHDQDEAERIIEGEVIRDTQPMSTGVESIDRLNAKVTAEDPHLAAVDGEVGEVAAEGAEDEAPDLAAVDGEVADEPVAFDDVVHAIQQAKNGDQLDLAMDLGNDLKPAERKKLQPFYDGKVKQLAEAAA